MDLFFSVDPASRGTISYIYNHMSKQLNTPMDILKSSWKEDLGIGLTEEQWIRAQDGVYISTQYNIRIKLLYIFIS